MNIVPYLMTSKGLVFLKALLDSKNLNILYVVSECDSALDKDYFKEIKELCSSCSIPFFHRLKAPKIKNDYLIIAVSWKWIINSNFSNIIVLHDSILPKYRGFNPLVSALINGDKEIGASAIFGNSDYDKGDIIKQIKRTITYPIKIKEAILIINELYIEIAQYLITYLSSGILPPSSPQEEEKATYSLWRNEEDYLINWHNTSKQIKRFIDAVGSPYKSASSYIDKKKVRIIEANEYPDKIIENRKPGKIIFIKNKLPVIVCGEGLLIIKKLEDDYGNSLLPLSYFRTLFKNYV